MLISIRNYRRVARANLNLAATPIALIAGRNGAGKTSIIQAAQAALLRKAVMVPGGTIKAAGRFVHRGSDGGSIELRGDAGSVTIAYPKCAITEDGTAPRTSEIAAGVVSILDLSGADRAKALARFVNGPTLADLKAEMLDIGYKAESVDAMWEKIQADGWDATHKASVEHGAKLKGAWEATTKTKFGPDKAASWRPEGWDDSLADATIEDLQAEVYKAETAFLDAVKTGAVTDAQAAAWKEQAEAAEHVDVDARKEALALAKEALAAVEKERAAAPGAPEDALACPHCAGRLSVNVPHAGGKITLTALPAGEALSEKEIKDRRLKIAGLDGAIERAKADVRAAEFALSTAERIFSDGQAAAQKLEGLDLESGGGANVEDARTARDRAAARLRTFQANAEAQKTVAAWSKNQKLIDALSPEGVRKTVLARSLRDLNDALRNASDAAGWGTVRFDEGLEAWLDAEAYADLSASMQWRVRVTLQATLAVIEQAGALLIDAADILDAPGRNGLFGLVMGTGIPTIIAMTANKPGGVPDLAAMGVGRTYWLDGGVASPIGAEQGEQAA